MDKLKVLVADPISPKGVEDLKSDGAFDVIFQTGLKEDQLLEIIPDCAALIVRSETKVNQRVLEAARALKVVGRAGVGVDNVDVEAATARGVIVMNTPDGNTISTAEHAFSLLVSVARTIPQASASVVGTGAGLLGPACASGAKAEDRNKSEATAEAAAGIPRVFIEDCLMGLSLNDHLNLAVNLQPRLLLVGSQMRHGGVEVVDHIIFDVRDQRSAACRDGDEHLASERTEQKELRERNVTRRKFPREIGKKTTL